MLALNSQDFNLALSNLQLPVILSFSRLVCDDCWPTFPFWPIFTCSLLLSTISSWNLRTKLLSRQRLTGNFSSVNIFWSSINFLLEDINYSSLFLTQVPDGSVAIVERSSLTCQPWRLTWKPTSPPPSTLRPSRLSPSNHLPPSQGSVTSVWHAATCLPRRRSLPVTAEPMFHLLMRF